MKKTGLPDYFLFTQYSLGTFDTCPLKFKRRYIDRLRWKGITDEDEEKRMEAGSNFHLLAHRYFMGIDCGLDKGMKGYDQLNIWLQALKRDFKILPDFRYLPEYKLRMADSPLKLEANFDLLIVGEDEIQIWDWKTQSDSSHRMRSRTAKKYENSLQTMVYMFVLKEQGRLVTGRELEFEKISMNYWQPDSTGVLAEIRYNSYLHESFRKELEHKIKEIREFDYNKFDRAKYIKCCSKCEFNWLCTNENYGTNL